MFFFILYRTKLKLICSGCCVAMVIVTLVIQQLHVLKIITDNTILLKHYEIPIYYGDNNQCFLVGRLFDEQLGMCYYHLNAFVQVAHLLNAKPLTPITCDSRLCTINGKYCQCIYMSESVACTKMPNKHGRFCSSNISLFDIYDETTLQADLQANDLPQLASLDAFMTRSYRSLILIHPIYLSYTCTTCYEAVGSKKVVPYLKNASIIECSFEKNIAEIRNDFLTELNLLAEQYRVHPFVVIATYCIRSWVPYNGSNLIKEWKIENNTSVVLTTWRGITNSGGVRTRIDNLPPLKIVQIESFKVSKLVINSAKNFLKIVTRGKPFIGIQMRSEHFRFFIKDKTTKKILWNCFNKISKIRETLLTKEPNLTYLHFWDLGQWGSAFGDIKVDGKPLRKLIKQTVFKDGEYKVNEYNPSIYGGPHDAGFVSRVEIEVLSEAKHLIVIGGGTYQDTIVKKFIRKNSGSTNLYSLHSCNLENYAI